MAQCASVRNNLILFILYQMLKTLSQQGKALGKAELSTLACPKRLKLTALTYLSC